MTAFDPSVLERTVKTKVAEIIRDEFSNTMEIGKDKEGDLTGHFHFPGGEDGTSVYVHYDRWGDSKAIYARVTLGYGRDIIVRAKAGRLSAEAVAAAVRSKLVERIGDLKAHRSLQARRDAAVNLLKAGGVKLQYEHSTLLPYGLALVTEHGDVKITLDIPHDKLDEALRLLRILSTPIPDQDMPGYMEQLLSEDQKADAALKSLEAGMAQRQNDGESTDIPF